MHWGISSRARIRLNTFLSHNFRCSPPYLKCSTFRPSRPPDLVSSMSMSSSMTWSEWPKYFSSSCGTLDATVSMVDEEVFELTREEKNDMEWFAMSWPSVILFPSTCSILHDEGCLDALKCRRSFFLNSSSRFWISARSILARDLETNWRTWFFVDRLASARGPFCGLPAFFPRKSALLAEGF